MPPIRKVLIANRGEIAVRIMRACAGAGIDFVTVYSDADATMPWVRNSSKSCRLGPAPVQLSYLSIDRLIEAAETTQCDAVHPGYGLLSENANFAKRVVDAGLIWIGPRPETISMMGVKPRARAQMREAGVPVVPGSDGEVADLLNAKKIAAELGYPVMVKAASGGGGIGMELAADEAALERAMKGVAERAKRFFGGESVYIEKALIKPRHIEVQIIGDDFGNVAHLYERECSIQRRNQKVVEESPAPLSTDRFPGLRDKITDAAVRAARAVGYKNAGTVEFLVDGFGNYYFLEMNCRLQVEHPVTECVTGMDIVAEQLRIAAGEKLSFTQKDIQQKGSAIELRLYAEDPTKNFMPSPGPIHEWEFPAAPGFRIDAGFGAGDAITPFYDPLIAKLIFHGGTRREAIERALFTLNQSRVGPLKTNLELHKKILANEVFKSGDLSTDFLKLL
ncbi:MAG: acetyl/propionyl/methylcrotonyl-CoA carboxylase subunit alpha [Planctomycetota bacterium]